MEMKKEKIDIPGGRTLIFYTFAGAKEEKNGDKK
jgi:hypothetical protein